MSILRKREDDTYYQQSPSLYDTAAIESWLEDSAREGYTLLRFEPHYGLRGVFRWTGSRECRYRLEPARQKTPDPEQIGMYEDLGWTYVTSVRPFYLWRCDDPLAPELETDPVIQAEGTRILRRKLLWSLVPCGILPLLPFLTWLLGLATLREIVEGYMPGAMLLMLLLAVGGAAQAAVTLRGLLRRQRSLAAGFPPSHTRPYRRQMMMARLLPYLWVAVVFLIVIGTSDRFDPRFAWRACDEVRDILPDPGAVYVDLRVLDGADTEATRWPQAKTKVQELAPRMYWTRQTAQLPQGDPITARSEYYRMLTPGLASVVAGELVDEFERREYAAALRGDTAGLDALWWGQADWDDDSVPDHQCAVALRGNRVLAVEYEGPTDLRGEAEYLRGLLEKEG